MIVVDVETTGLNPQKNSLLSIGAVDFSRPDRQFYEECRIWDGAHVEKDALAVNGYLPSEIIDPNKQTEDSLVRAFLHWVEQCDDRTVAGQNPFVDVSFIQEAAKRGHFEFSLAHRIIDLHSISYFHMKRRGLLPPIKNYRTDLNSDAIMGYVGIPAEPKPHIAINGAKWEAEAFNRLFKDTPLFEEFKRFPIPWLKK